MKFRQPKNIFVCTNFKKKKCFYFKILKSISEFPFRFAKKTLGCSNFRKYFSMLAFREPRATLIGGGEAAI